MVTEDYYQVIKKTEPKFSDNQLIKGAHVLFGNMEGLDCCNSLEGTGWGTFYSYESTV